MPFKFNLDDPLQFGVELNDCGEGSTVVGNVVVVGNGGGKKKTAIGFAGLGTEDAVTLSDNKLS